MGVEVVTAVVIVADTQVTDVVMVDSLALIKISTILLIDPWQWKKKKLAR